VVTDRLEGTGRGLASPERDAVRDALHHAWATFAATGEPGWPLCDADAHDATRQFGAGADYVTEPPRDEVSALWHGRH
jgi:para-nitrobenzyl esterase